MKKVLILEDHENTLNALAKIVRSVAEDVVIYEYVGLEGVFDRICNETIDLFIVDIILDPTEHSDVSGLKFIEKLRRMPVYEFTPVICITALYDPKLYVYSHLHVYEYVEKPFDPERLTESIRSALRFKRPVTEQKSFHFKQDGLFYVLPYKDILYIENYLHKIHIHMTNGKELTGSYRSCEMLMKELEGSHLVQCSRRAIINADYIEVINLKQNTIRLKGIRSEIRIGTTYKGKMRDVYSLL